MKTCSRCKLSKEFSEFAISLKRGYQAYCKSCVKDYDSNRYLTTDRPTKVREISKAAVKRNRDFLADVLKNSSCIDCGNSDSRVLEFDHLDSTSKTANVTAMVTQGWSIDKIKQEIKKCAIRCCNCHRIITGERGNWWRNSL